MDTNQVATPDPFLYIHLVSHILSYLSLHKHYLARCFQVCKMWHSLTPPFFFKPHLSVAFLGPSQCGKSTLLGHLLYKTGNVKEEVMEDNIRVLEQAPMQMYNKFSMLLDVLKAERNRGITIDPKSKALHTRTYDFTLIDTPGSIGPSNNSPAQGDVAVIVTSMEIPNQEFIYLVQTILFFGSEIPIVVLNNMRTESSFAGKRVEARKVTKVARQEQIAASLRLKLEEGGCNTKDIRFIPVAALNGDNITEHADYPWYDGPTLLEALLEMREPPRMYSKPLRLTIVDSYKILNVGVVLVGRIHTGVMRTGMHLSFVSSCTTQVLSMEIDRRSVDQAVAGDWVSFQVSETNRSVFTRGMVAGDANCDPPKGAKSIVATVQVKRCQGKISCGFSPIITVGMSRVACKLTRIIERRTRTAIDSPVATETATFLTVGDEALVELQLKKPTYFSIPSEYLYFSRFIIKELGVRILLGVVQDVIHD